MSQTLTLKIKGLYTLQNLLSEIPDGALSQADNIVIDGESLASPRRGFDRQTYGFSNANDRADNLFAYQSQLLSHRENTTISYYGGSGWVDYSGTYAIPTQATKMRTAQANQNLYMATSSGVQKLDAYTNSIMAAGVPKGLDGSATTTGASGFLATGYQCAYRVVWGYEDENRNLILGAPSQRIILSNSSGGTRDGSITFTIPTTITTSFFYQVYRSAQVTTSTEPSDELKLVYEASPSSAEISAKSVTITDSTTDSLRGTSLYTNASQEGITEANEQPPIAADIAVFSNHTFYANTISKNRYYLNLLAVGGSTGIAAANVINIAGKVYTGAAAETVANAEFKVSTGGTASQNIEDTAKSLVKVINQYASTNGIYAYYLSGFEDLPGKMLIEERGLGGSSFHLSSNNTTCFNPNLPSAKSFTTGDVNTGTDTITVAAHGYSNGDSVVFATNGTLPTGLSAETVYYIINAATNTFKVSLTSGGSAVDITTTGSGTFYVQRDTEVSANDTFVNGLMFSKNQQPEAVPLTHLFRVGSADKKIKRIVPLRDSMFVLKEDGAYRVTGSDISSFRVELFDNTVRIIGSETAANLNNQIFALTDQGVVAITETGVSVISRPIEDTILALFGASLDNVAAYSFGISYETDRKYILFTISSSGDAYATQAFVFNTFTNTWTRWDLARTCGIVNPADNKLYLGSATTNYITPEIKNYSFRDHGDFLKTTTISAQTSTTLTLSDVTELTVGDVIYQSASVYSRITAIDANTSSITIANAITFALTTATIYKAIATAITWAPTTGGNPGVMKHWREVTYLFQNDYAGDADIEFSSDLSQGYDSVTISGTATGSWGLFGWGEAPWGGAARIKPTRTYVTREKSRANQLINKFTHAVGFSQYKLAGISVIYEYMSERTIR